MTQRRKEERQPTGATEAEPAWESGTLADPHAAPDKARRVRRMFAAIADSYDLNNRVHSFGRDQAWRRAAVRLCRPAATDVVLDAACGTGDLTLAFADAGVKRAIGVDFTHEMTALGRQKANRDADRRPAPVDYADGDATRLPVADRSVDIVSIAFGIRNVADPAAAMREFHRVLRPGGRVCVLEFSQPANPLLRRMYELYFHHVLPRTATLVSGDRSGAYRYLPRSVNTFLDREQMQRLMGAAGFGGLALKPLTFGIAVAYLGRK
jgi:demethylmenaquinone methyltransferase/2-methoxy-6-polyprenyl-1,4-benzoquinol methylase